MVLAPGIEPGFEEYETTVMPLYYASVIGGPKGNRTPKASIHPCFRPEMVLLGRIELPTTPYQGVVLPL